MVYIVELKELFKDIIDKVYTKLYKGLYKGGEEARYIIRKSKNTQNYWLFYIILKTWKIQNILQEKLFLVKPLTFLELHGIL